MYRIAHSIAAYLKQGRESWLPSAADFAAFVPPTRVVFEAAP